MRKLEGKVAVVTGAGRGLGRAYAVRLASLGAKVAIADVDLDSFAEFEDRAMGSTSQAILQGGGECRGYEFDIADRGSVFGMAEDVVTAWGRIDILVANAGGGRGTPKDTRASMIPPDLLELVTQMNFYGTVHSCSAVAPTMKAQKAGKIITVASYAGLVANAGGGYAHYGANKAAIAHYTRYLAQELGPHGVTANCIAPGVIDTARIVKLMADSGRGSDVSDIALRRNGTPDDCANVVEFLSTDLSDYVTGAVIPIDGGWNRAG